MSFVVKGTTGICDRLSPLTRRFRWAALLLGVLVLTGCDLPLQQLGPRERGVVFRRLPTFLGGGVGTSVHPPGALVMVWPWDSIYRMDTGSRDVSLGEGGQHDDMRGFVFTRAKDGNEVALKMTVRYRVRETEDSLVKLVHQVATTDEELEQIVVTVSRAEIRLHMNQLRTSGFLGESDRYEAIDNVRAGIQAALDQILPDAIEVMAVMLDRFEFARLLPTGGVDRSYQDKLNEVLRIKEETERERLRIETVKAEGERREFDAQAMVNRLEQEALGIKQQAMARGDGYLARKQNEAKSILALGKSEVQGIVEKINALEGPGGAAILKLDLARALVDANSRFVLMGSGASAGGNSIDVKRVDTNDLLGQLGVFEAMTATPAPKRDAGPALGVEQNSKLEPRKTAPVVTPLAAAGRGAQASSEGASPREGSDSTNLNER